MNLDCLHTDISQKRYRGILPVLLWSKTLTFTLLLLLGVASYPALSSAQIVVDTLSDVADAPFDAGDNCFGGGSAGTTADLPGADGFISLREAIVAANNTAGADTITFDSSLSGGTINVGLDPNPGIALPNLCGDGTTIDGEFDGSNSGPDITLDGAGLAFSEPGFTPDILTIRSSNNTIRNLIIQNYPEGGIGVFSNTASGFTTNNNAVENNIISGGTNPIFVQAGVDVTSVTFGTFQDTGTVSNTQVTGNTVSNSLFDGILVFTVFQGVSTITGTTVSNNTAMNNARHGISVSTSSGSDGNVITDVDITDNEATGNGGVGILTIAAFQGSNNSISDVDILRNTTSSNLIGIEVIGADGNGVGASGNTIDDVLIDDNTVTENDSSSTDGTSGIVVIGSANVASNNQVTNVQVSNNTVEDNLGGGAVYVGGGVVSADSNTVSATVYHNTVSNNAGSGIGIISGLDNSSNNTNVTVSVTENTVDDNEDDGIFAVAGVGAFLDPTGTSTGNILNITIDQNFARNNGRNGLNIAGAGASGDSRKDTEANNNQTNATVTNNTVANSTAAGMFLIGGSTGEANNNTLTLVGDASGNSVCANGLVDIRAVGGFKGNNPFPRNKGTGNTVTGTLNNNTATTVEIEDGIAGNTATVTETNTTACDVDGDGILNPIDGTFSGVFTDESALFSNDFTNEHLGGTTFGTVIDRSNLDLVIQEAADSDGVLLSAPSGGGTATVDACDVAIQLTKGDSVIATCGSLTTEVLVGPVELMLSGSTEVIVPAGATATVEEDPSDPTMFLITNDPESTGTVVIEAQGETIELNPGDDTSIDPDPEDFAVVQIKAPKFVTLTGKKPTPTKQVKVQIQNQAPHNETIPDLAALGALVSLTLESVNGACPAPVATLIGTKPPLPLTLKPKRKVNVVFDVEFSCVNDGAKSSKKAPGHEDYRYIATVDHAAFDTATGGTGEADSDTIDDVCPRTIAPPFRLDPNPNGKLKDRGCGAKKPDKTFGADVLTDVVDKR